MCATVKLNDTVKEAKKPKVNITPVQPSQSHVTPPPQGKLLSAATVCFYFLFFDQFLVHLCRELASFPVQANLTTDQKIRKKASLVFKANLHTPVFKVVGIPKGCENV